jgi:hypothetical protein
MAAEAQAGREDETGMRLCLVGRGGRHTSHWPHPGLTCHPGSAPNMDRLACAPRTSSLNTNCVKEFGIVMQHRLHFERIGSQPELWLASVT